MQSVVLDNLALGWFVPASQGLFSWASRSPHTELTRFFDFAQNGKEVTPLEERIGYKFRNSLLLAEALTHPSLGHEAQHYHFDYQRLEFLGDAVLQLVITEYLFRHFRAEAEGQLTKLRSRLVSREALRTHAATLDLGRYILMGRGEESSGGRERTSTLADAFEALIGAHLPRWRSRSSERVHFDADSR